MTQSNTKGNEDERGSHQLLDVETDEQRAKRIGVSRILFIPSSFWRCVTTHNEASLLVVSESAAATQ